MRFSVNKQEKYVVLRLDEPCFTNDYIPELKSEFTLLNAEGFRNMVFDLSAVSECIDAQDLSCLLTADRLCKSANGLFIVTGIQDSLAGMMKVSGLGESLTIVSRLDEAEDLIFMEEIEREFLGGIDED